MFAIFRECAQSFIQKRRIKRKLTFALLGLDDAGKTTTAKGLCGEADHADTTVTIGFDKDDIRLGKYGITLFDLGGGKKIRDIWKNYLAEVHGIIFVVDASTFTRMEETKEVLETLLEHPSMSGKPMLLLANKQDKMGALDELEVCEVLTIETLVNKNRCPCRVESCSASFGTGKKMDPNIVDGLMWLCTVIDENYDTVSARMTKELKELNLQKEKESAERKERVRQIRKERERQRLECGQNAEEVNTKEDENLKNGNGNPFQRLNSDYFSKQEKENSIRENTPTNLPAVESVPSPSHFYSSPVRDTERLLPSNANQNNSVFLTKSISVVSSRQDTLAPPKDLNSKRSSQRPNRPLPDLSENNSANSKPLLAAIEDPSQTPMKKNAFLKKNFLQPLDMIDCVPQTNPVKKKKKKLKKNHVAPIKNEPDEKINLDATTVKNATHLSFVNQPFSSNDTRTQTSEPTSGNDLTESRAISRKWNRVEELPYIEKLTVEDDDDDDIIT